MHPSRIPLLLLAFTLGCQDCLASIPESGAEGIVRQFNTSGIAGDSIRLPCDVDKANCGPFHNIKWYKENDRVYIFSEIANINNAEGALMFRANFQYSESGTGWLEIPNLRPDDQGSYKCEITYLTVEEACSVVQFVNLTTFARPVSHSLTFEDGSPIENGTSIGPFDEGTTLGLVCNSVGGKPVAAVSWWNGTTSLPGQYSAQLEQDGTGTGSTLLQVRLSREDLNGQLVCQANNPALNVPSRVYVQLDVNVSPSIVEMGVIEQRIEEGGTTTLVCIAKGAKPAAQIVWKNGTVPVLEAETTVNSNESDNVERSSTDGTYITQSRLTFKATRFENGKVFSCLATNPVIENRGNGAVVRSVELDVLYAPSVKVSPENITVNESMDVLIFCQYEANPEQLTHVYWYQNGKQVDVKGNPDKYSNGDVRFPSLLIKNSTASDIGEYTCRVANDIGQSVVENSAFVGVHYRPEVQVLMSPEGPISENDRLNVTLECDVIRANPENLIRVRWYLGGELLKELPECDGNETLYDSDSELCDIVPSRLMLEYVYNMFHGNYSCEGMNEAGWGPRSSQVELIVNYAPGDALITYTPSKVIKGEPLELTCSLNDPGRPPATTFRWYRGNHLVPDVTTGRWLINPVSLETETNFTCIPYNSEGEGAEASTDIDVLAKPTFISRLPPYHGALMNSKDISLSCRVECSPICSISWLKDGKPLLNSSHFSIVQTALPPDSSSGDMESVLSVLSWRMEMWPEGQLDREKDNTNLTCRSSSNAAGPAISSHSFFRVEYSPERIDVSLKELQIMEGELPPRIDCKAESYPEASYNWTYKGLTVSSGPVLILDTPLSRRSAGEYQCRAENRHGHITASTVFDVLFKPECTIYQTESEEKDGAFIVLVCRAKANPTNVTFRWRRGNDTLTEDVKSEGLRSQLRLLAESSSFATYYCYVNNSVGESIPCEIDVTGVLDILEKFGDDKVIIIVAIAAAVIVILLIICLILVLYCRRHRQAGKYPEGTIDTPLQPQNNPGTKGPLPPAGDEDRTFYENLPFHGIQQPPNKPLLSGIGSDMEYADVDSQTYVYGPIPYKAASVIAAREKNSEKEAEMMGVPVRPPRKK